jgi:hypothetical protein
VFYPDEQDAYRQVPLPYQPQVQQQPQWFPPNGQPGQPQPQHGYPPSRQPQPQRYPPYGQSMPVPGYAGRNEHATRPYINQSTTREPRPNMRQPLEQRPRTAPKAKVKPMPKAEALSLVEKLKHWIVIGSVVTFGALGGLVISHTVGVTSTQATNNSTQQSVPSSSSSSSSSSSQSGGFFQQQQNQGQGGYGFGSSNGTSQPPVSSSGVS